MIDLSHLNDFVQLTRFKMETVASVLLSVREGDFLASLDLKVAYYQFRALCFGLSIAPQVFTRVFAVVSAWAHSHGIRLLRYVDDWLVLSSSEREAKQVVRSLLSVCRTLRIVINEKKSDLLPSQTAKYLGVTIDTEAGKVFPSGASREIPDGSGELLCHGLSPSSALAGDPWSPGFARAAGSSRSSLDALSAVASEDALVPRVRSSLSSGGFATGSEMGPVLVDGEGPSLNGGSIRDTCAGSSPVFGRVLLGVGRSPPRPTRVWGVVRPGKVAPHQSSRNEGPLSGSSGLSRRSHRSSRDSDVRQLDGRGVRQQTGGTVSRALCLLTSRLLRWTESFDVHLDARYLPGENNVLADLLSCRGRVVGTEWSLHLQVARSLLRMWGNPSVDLFVTCLNAKLPLYCSLVPDPQAVLQDAFLHPWDDLDLYAFPLFPLVGRVIARVRESSRVAMTGRASLAREGVVRKLATSTDPTSFHPDLVGQPAPAAPLQPLPPRHPHVKPSRVATLKRHFRKSGFLGRAARVLSGCLRESSSRLYQSRWQIFCCCCRGRGVAPVNATIPVVVDFLIHLRLDKGLSISAVKGYSSALNSVLALKGRDLASSREIAMLLHNFSRSVNPVELRPPAWDVSLVLQSLTGAPYEPLRTREERFLAQKMLFLLALVSAKRIGELHALSYRVSHTRNRGEVSFSYVTGFVAKTQDPSSLAPRFEGFSVPALPNARNNRNGRLLCPVRAVRRYLDRTVAHRPRCEWLFVTAGHSKKEISKTTVAWLRKTISRAYELSGTGLPVPAPRARETRGIAPSLLFKKNFAVDQVLKAGTWRRHTSFTRHYLGDLAHRSLDTFHLGPVVAAQAVV